MKTKLLMVLGLALTMSITACNLGGGPASKSSSQEQQNSTSAEVSSSNNEITSSQNTSSFFSSILSSSQTASSSQTKSSSEQKSSSSQESSSIMHTHSWDQGAVTTEPGCETTGVKTYTCSCGETRTEEIDALGHDYGNLIDGYLPSYFYDGSKPYYQCSRCHQKFDSNKNSATDEQLKLEKASDLIVITVNDVEKGPFYQVDKDESHAEWSFSGLYVNTGDVLSITKPGDPTYKYQFFRRGNLDENNKIITSGCVDLSLTATPNGFSLSVSGYKYPGLVVKINDDEYPMNEVMYYNYATKTHIFGYVRLIAGDVVTVVDNVRNIVYGYNDAGENVLWNTYDFERYEGAAILVLHAMTCGIEFEPTKNKILITKVFEPAQDVSSYYVSSGSQGRQQMEVNTIEPGTQAYTEATWYLFNEKVTCNEAYKKYLDYGEKSFNIYTLTVDFTEGEIISVAAASGRVIAGENLSDLRSSNIVFYGGSIHATGTVTAQIGYTPLFDTLFIYEVENPQVDEVYVLLGGVATPIQAIDSIAEFTFHANKGNTLSFIYGGAQLNCTLAAGYDATVVSCTQGLIIFMKPGTFKATLDLRRNVVTITVIELDVTYTYYFHVLDMANSSNSKNYTMKVSNGVATAKNVTVTPGLYFYVMKYNDVTMDGVQFGTLDPSVDSSIASLAFSTYYVWNTSGTFNVSINLSTELITISSAS